LTRSTIIARSELGKDPHHLKHRLPGWCAGVDPLLMEVEIDPLGVQSRCRIARTSPLRQCTYASARAGLKQSAEKPLRFCG
jgi:hypothetical protein